MNDTTYTPTPTPTPAPAPDGAPVAADRASDPGSQLLAWVNDHPVAALTVAGVVGATLGAIVVSASGRSAAGETAPRGPTGVPPTQASPSHVETAGSGAAPPPPDDTAAIEPVLRALLGGAAALAVAALQRWTAADGIDEPDPVADLADTDQFARAPEVPPDFGPAG